MVSLRYGVSDGVLEGPVWLGVDQSLTGFGTCLIDGGGSYMVSVVSPNSRGAERLCELHDHLESILAEHKPVRVAIEGTVFSSSSASVLGELAGVLKMALHRAGSDALVIPPMTLKKFVIGKATSTTKSQMLLSVYKRYGVELVDDNAADAYGLARIARGIPDGAVERDILAKISPKHRI